jgi:hypothetical protein
VIARILRALGIAGLAVAGLAGGASGCTAEEQQRSEEQAAVLAKQADALAVDLTALTPTDITGVVVQLVFGEEADLDLYVTDPLLDTVYFARHETRTGGRISSDVRCDDAGPRIEEVRFDAPWPGRYRVGVDHPTRCDGTPAPAPAAFAVTVYADGKTYHAKGSVALEQFEVVVLDFEVRGSLKHSPAEYGAVD